MEVQSHPCLQSRCGANLGLEREKDREGEIEIGMSERGAEGEKKIKEAGGNYG